MKKMICTKAQNCTNTTCNHFKPHKKLMECNSEYCWLTSNVGNTRQHTGKCVEETELYLPKELFEV